MKCPTSGDKQRPKNHYAEIPLRFSWSVLQTVHRARSRRVEDHKTQRPVSALPGICRPKASHFMHACKAGCSVNHPEELWFKVTVCNTLQLTTNQLSLQLLYTTQPNTELFLLRTSALSSRLIWMPPAIWTVTTIWSQHHQAAKVSEILVSPLCSEN